MPLQIQNSRVIFQCASAAVSIQGSIGQRIRNSAAVGFSRYFWQKCLCIGTQLYELENTFDNVVVMSTAPSERRTTIITSIFAEKQEQQQDGLKTKSDLSRLCQELDLQPSYVVAQCYNFTDFFFSHSKFCVQQSRFLQAVAGRFRAVSNRNLL